jgi:hypothetical protein
MNKYPSRNLSTSKTMSLRLLLTLQGTIPLELLFDNFEDSIPLSFLHNSSLQKDSCTHSLRQFFKYFQVFEPLRLCALPATTVFQQFRSGCNSETSLGLRTPCTAPVLNLHFCENENNVIPPELAETNSDFCQRTPCGQFHCTPCRKTLAQTEKQLKLIPYSPSLQISDIKYEIIHSRIKENA